MVATGCPVGPVGEQTVSTGASGRSNTCETFAVTVPGWFEHVLENEDRLLEGDFVVAIGSDRLPLVHVAGFLLGVIED